MKICPRCSSKYTDDTLRFCLQDGSLLVSEHEDHSSGETMSFDEQETVVSSGRRRVGVNIEQPQETKNATQPLGYSNSEPKSSKALKVVLLTALGSLGLFSILALGAWFYVNQNGNRVSQNNDEKSSNVSGEDNTASDVNKEIKNTPSQKDTPQKTATPKQTENKPIDKKQIAEEISDTLSAWKAAAESRNLSAYINNYAEKLDYYNRIGASRSFVQSDKKRAFEGFTSIRSRFSNIRITPSKDGKTATAQFDKEWDFTSEEKKSSGKVRSQIMFRKTSGRWLIISEKDVKVYYVNK